MLCTNSFGLKVDNLSPVSINRLKCLEESNKYYGNLLYKMEDLNDK